MTTGQPEGEQIEEGGLDQGRFFLSFPSLPRTDSEPFNIEAEREKVRGWLAKALVIILGVSVATSFALAGGGWLKVSDSLSILGVVAGVVGTVLGFYFGGHPPSKGPGSG